MIDAIYGGFRPDTYVLPMWRSVCHSTGSETFPMSVRLFSRDMTSLVMLRVSICSSRVPRGESNVASEVRFCRIASSRSTRAVPYEDKSGPDEVSYDANRPGSYLHGPRSNRRLALANASVVCHPRSHEGPMQNSPTGSVSWPRVTCVSLSIIDSKG